MRTHITASFTREDGNGRTTSIFDAHLRDGTNDSTTMLRLIANCLKHMDTQATQGGSPIELTPEEQRLLIMELFELAVSLGASQNMSVEALETLLYAKYRQHAAFGRLPSAEQSTADDQLRRLQWAAQTSLPATPAERSEDPEDEPVDPYNVPTTYAGPDNSHIGPPVTPQPNRPAAGRPGMHDC